MPAIGRTNKPVRVETLQQRRGRRSQRHTPRPSPQTLARAQERSYGSQGRAVERVAGEQRQTAATRQYIRRVVGSGFGQARDYRAASLQDRRRGMGAMRDRAVRQSQLQELLNAYTQEQHYSQPRQTFNTQTRLPYDPEVRARRIAELRETRATGLDFAREALDKARRAIPHGTELGDPVFAAAHKAAATIADQLAGEEGGRGGRSPFKTVATSFMPGIAIASERQAEGLVRNAIEYPLLAPQAVYEATAAAAEAARGDTARAERLGKGLTEGVIGLAAQGRWDELEEYMQDNPLFALQELRGAKAFVGRGTGAVMRSGVTGERARQAASTRRADLDLGAGRMADRRHYSPDVLTKMAQVAIERARGERANRPIGPDQGRRQRTRADFQSDAAVSSTRASRAEEAKFARDNRPVRSRNRFVQAVERRLPSGKTRGVPALRPEADVVSLVVQRVVRSTETLERDLRAELQRLDSIPRSEFRSSVQYKQNRAQAAAIKRVLDSPKALENAHEIARSAEAIARRSNDLEQRAIKLGALDEEAATRAKLFPYAQTYMGAKHEGMTRAQGKRLVGKARREIERAKGARAHVLERLRSEGVKTPTKHADYKKANAAVKAAQEALGKARHDRRTDARSLRGADGKPLSNREIVEHMRQNGVPFDKNGNPLVAYLPHRPDVRGARAYYQTAFAGRRDVTGSQRRTGEAQRKGTYESSYDLPTEHLIRLRGVVERIEQHDRMIHDVATRKPNGEAWTWEQATRLAENLNDRPGAAQLVPYRTTPSKYDKQRIRDIIDHQDPEASPDLADLVEHDFKARLNAPHPADRGAKNVVLVPEQFVHRLEQQMRPAGDAGKIGNIFTGLFRTTVLPFSTKWLVGNSAEAVVRLAAVGAGPNSHRIGKLVIEELRKLDADQARQVEAALFAGLHFGNQGLTVTRRADQFEHTGLRVPAQAIAAAGRLPGPKQLIGIIKGYTNSVFALNRHIEQQAQIAAFGKWSRREMQEFTGSWAKATKAQEKAVQDVARGLLDTKNIHDAARYMDETLGKYSRFSPGLRRAIQSGAPFLPWFINSVRFVYWTLPAKHPIKTALLLNLENTVREEWEHYTKSLPPGSLRASIPVEGGVKDFARFTPFGFPADLHGGDPSALIDPFLPQVKSAALALWGLNFTGRPATVSGGEVTTDVKLAMAANSLLEAFVPGIAIARRVMEGGGTPYDNSNIISPKTKPGTQGRESAANRILNPVRTIPIGGKGPGGGSASDEVQRLLQGAGGGGAPRMDPGEVQRLLQGLGG